MRILIFIIACALAWISNCQAAVRGDLTHSYFPKPGDKIRGKITLGNDRDLPEEVLLEINDYSFNCSGEVFFEDPETYPRSNAGWIQLHTDKIVIPPHSESDVFYTIEVPEKVASQGSYWSVILVEPQTTFSAQQLSADQMQVNIKIRYANHIITTLGNPQAKLKILSKEPGILNEKKVLNIDVANTGELFLDPKLSLKVYDKTGKALQTLNAPKQRIYPDTSVRYSLDIAHFVNGNYTGFLILDAGNDHLFGDRFEFKAD